MKTEKMVNTTNKRAKRVSKKSSIIVAIAAATGMSVSATTAAARQALADMQDALGADCVYKLTYNWDPFDGVLA